MGYPLRHEIGTGRSAASAFTLWLGLAEGRVVRT